MFCKQKSEFSVESLNVLAHSIEKMKILRRIPPFSFQPKWPENSCTFVNVRFSLGWGLESLRRERSCIYPRFPPLLAPVTQAKGESHFSVFSTHPNFSLPPKLKCVLKEMEIRLLASKTDLSTHPCSEKYVARDMSRGWIKLRHIVEISLIFYSSGYKMHSINTLLDLNTPC